MKKLFVITMSILTLLGCKPQAQAPNYPTDTLTARDGSAIDISFFKHASLALRVGDQYIYIDPVSDYADYSKLPKADLILITHSHSDHLDSLAVDAIRTSETKIICDSTSAATFGTDCFVMRPGEQAQPRDYVNIEAIAAYNTSEAQLQFHPRERKDCGYLLTIGGTRIYIAGDTEPTPEMLTLRNLDVAFLPVNQPYTMTVDQAVAAVNALRPAIFYPYHYGGTDQTTDIDRLARELKEVTEVRIRPME